MIKAQINLYPIVYNKQYSHYQVLSDHPDRYQECYSFLVSDISMQDQIYLLFKEYFDLDPGFIKFIHLAPKIIEETLILPVYCLVPYLVKLNKGYLLPVHPYATHISYIRQALNII